jgi:hypothetical protein
LTTSASLEDRVRRLESAVIYLQEIALHADTSFKGKEDKAAIEALSALTAAMSSEHQDG